MEYRVIQLHSRDAGKREGKFCFNVGQGTQDIGFRNEVDILFDCQPTREVTLRVRDNTSKPTIASFLIRDRWDRIYPALAKRLAPDFSFQAQVYRGDGETLKLPNSVSASSCRAASRCPGFHLHRQQGHQGTVLPSRALGGPGEIRLDDAGDHHIHAAGCSHCTPSPPRACSPSTCSAIARAKT